MKHHKYSIALTIIVSLSIIYLITILRARPACPVDTTILHVGTNAEFPPFEFIEQDTIVGFDIDIVEEIAKRMSKTIVWHNMPFDTLIPEIQAGTIHMIAAGMNATEERAQRVLFTKPYIVSDPFIIITQAHNPQIRSTDDLLGKDVIVNEGYTADMYMSKIEGINLIRLPTVAESFLALQSNRGYAFVTARIPAEPFFKKYGHGVFAVTQIAGTAESSSLALSKQCTSLLIPVQTTLDAMEHDGTIATLKQKWGIS